MKAKSNDFIPAVQISIADPALQAAVTHATHHSDSGRQAKMFAYGEAHAEALRQQAAAAKRRALSQLPDLLEQAEANLIANGAEVLWALDANEANQYVLDIARRHGVQTVVKSKTMVSEELGLNHALEGAGIEVVETDLGEYIIQLSGETPSHIVGPAIHKSKETIGELFVEKLGMEPTNDAAEMTKFARQQLRQIFLAADMGISGGNFVIAETGTICLVTNEGNGRMVTSLPKVHVALVGIEKIAATIEDYATLVQVLTRSATGQTMPVYTHMINGPRRPGEIDGPEHMYVIFVDNGRSDIYSTSYAEILACLRCGACLNACPVYKIAGGHAYGWVYPGPVGSVITPLLIGLKNAVPLPYASSLCGLCKQVCPVDIDLPRMLLDLRWDLVQERRGGLIWNLGIWGWSVLNQFPLLFGIGSRLASAFNGLTSKRLPGPLGGWTKYREFPRFAEKPFRQLWNERRKEKGVNHVTQS